MHTRFAPLAAATALALVATLCLMLGACVEEFPLEGEAEVRYLFVAGGVEAGATAQEVRIAYTAGAGIARGEAAAVTALTVREPATGREHAFAPCPDDVTGEGRWCAGFPGELGVGYQLTFTLADGRAFVSAVESLGPGTLTLTGVVAARRRLGLGGDSVLNGDAGMRVAFEVPAGGTEGLLVFTPGAVDYSLSERFCGGLDPTLNCYFTEAPRQPGLTILPLDGLAGGSPYRGLVGAELVDYRFAQLAYYTVAYERLGAAALPYYRSLATSLAAGGSFFAERPLTLPGNVVQVEAGDGGAAPTEVLGYFAVRERGFLREVARGDDIDALAPRPPCSQYGLGVPRLDCCNCFSLPGASVTPPAWWPE